MLLNYLIGVGLLYLLNFIFHAECIGFDRVLITTFLLLFIQVILFVVQTQLIAAPYAYSFLIFGTSFDKQAIAAGLTVIALTCQFFVHKFLIHLPAGRTLISVLLLFIISQIPSWSASHSLIRMVTVTESNMIPTLSPGDCVLVRINATGRYQPKANDLIAYSSQDGGRNDQNWQISRLVGLPGDKLSVSEGRIFINKHPVGVSSSAIRTSHGKTYIIPDGVCYHLGDNADLSIDSRQLGLLPFNEIKGRVEFILFPAFPRLLTLNSILKKPDQPPAYQSELP